MSSLCGIDSGRIVSSNEPALQFSRPIEKLGENQHAIASVMRLGACFVVVVVVEAAEAARQPTQHPDQTQVRCTVGDDQAETLLAGEGHTLFGLRLHELQGIPYRQVIRDQYVPAVR